MIRGERAFGLDMTKALPNRNWWFIQRGIWNREVSAYLEQMQTFSALTHDLRPYRESIRGIYRNRGLDSSTVGKVFAEEVSVGMKSIHTAVTRTRAEIRALRVLNAIQVHVPTISDLPKLDKLGLPVETTTDPFTGEPLHVKKTPQGWLVYSVGPNLKDDGGKLGHPLEGDIGIGPPPPAGKSAEK
jgi:hypothetical protein